MFWLYAPNELSQDRADVLAFMASNSRRLYLAEASRILGVRREPLRARLRRAAEVGWTRYLGHNHWELNAAVTTDVEMLMAAVEGEDEEMAAAIASRMGSPLPTLRADWIDDRAGGPTPREMLRETADLALAKAAELWPENKAFLAAADRLYEDA